MIDFRQLHLYQENNRIEAKQARGGLPDSIWETYSAFANTLGGIILLGVMECEDKSFRSIRLSSPEWLAEEFWTRLTDGSHVNSNILSRDDIRIEESEGNRIVVIEVPRADRQEKPIYTGPDPFSGSYRRNGEGDYRCTREEVESMLRDRTDSSPDMQPINELTIKDLKADSVIRYHALLASTRSGEPLIRLDFPEFLLQLGAAAQNADNTLHPTAGGLFFFGQYDDICRFFPRYTLNYTEHSIQKNMSWDFQMNLFEYYCEIGRRVDSSTPFDTSEISIHHAFREVLANALIHADYHIHSDCCLSVIKTDDELLIRNPGSFRVRLRDALNGDISDPRNIVLSKLFGLILPRPRNRRGLSAVLSVWEDQGWAIPRIREEFSPDRTTLVLPLKARSQKTQGLPVQTAIGELRLSRTVRDQQIIEALTNHPQCTLRELCDELHLGESRVRTLLRTLIRQEVVMAKGKGTAKTYQLKT